MGKGIVKLGEGNWAVKDGNLLAAKETNGRFKNAEFTVARGTRATYVGRDGLIKESNLQVTNLVQNGDFEELGDELVTNGGFDTDSDWGISSYDTIIEDGVAKFPTTNGSFLIQSSVVPASVKQYRLQYDVVETNGGSLRLSGGSSAFATTSLNSSLGTHTFYLQSNGTQTNLQFNNQSSFVGSIDNISLKEIDPNDRWTLGGGWSIVNGEAVHTGSGNYIEQGSLTPGNQYKVVIVVTQADGVGFPQIYMGGLTTAMASPDTYTFYITAQSGDTIKLRGLNDCKIGSVSVQEIKTDTPRIDFTNNTDGHLLLEPQSTNLVPYSQDFQQGWSVADATITPNSITSPSGQDNAFTLTTSASGGTVQETLTISNGNLTFSLFVKKGTTNGVRLRIDAATDVNGYFNINDGTIFSQTDDAKIEVINADWYRVSISASVTSFVKASIYTTDGTTSYDNGAVYIWGAQLEQLPYATSYIPTNGSTVTRDGETCTGAGEAADFNSSEGVLYAEIAALADDISQQIGVYGGSSTKQLRIEIANSVIRAQLYNGAYQANMSSTQTVTNFNKIAFKWKVNDFALWINGTEVDTDSSGTTFSAATLDNINFSAQNGSSSKAQAKVKALRVYKEALSDTDLGTLTS